MADLDAGYSTGGSSTEDIEFESQDDFDVITHDNTIPTSNLPQDYSSFLNELGVSLDVAPDVDSTQNNLEKIKSDRFQRNSDFLKNISFNQHKTRSFSCSALTTQDVAATIIQKHYRGHLGRKHYLQKLRDHIEHEEKLNLLKQQKQLEEGELLIETHKLEMEYAAELLAIKYRQQTKQHNAIIIQRAWRHFFKGK